MKNDNGEKFAKKRIWMPKVRATKFQDRRTKRERTRETQLRRILKEYQ